MLGLKQKGDKFILGEIAKDWKPGTPLQISEEIDAERPKELIYLLDPQWRPRQKAKWGYPSLFLAEVELDIYHNNK